MPASTAKGFPYPLPTEPVAEGAQAIRNLAESVDTFLTPLSVKRLDEKILAADGVITFSSIPQTSKHLLLVAGLRSQAAAAFDNICLRFNGDTGANYTYGNMGANDAAQANTFAASSAFIICGQCTAGTAAANNWGGSFILVPNYTIGFMHSIIVASFGGVGQQTTRFGGGLHTAAVALNSVTLFAQAAASNFFATGSRCSLYGLG